MKNRIYDIHGFDEKEIDVLEKQAPLGFVSNLRVNLFRFMAGYAAAKNLKMQLHLKTWQLKHGSLCGNFNDGFNPDKVVRDTLHEAILEERGRGR